VDSVSNIVDVVSVETRDTDSSVLGQVDVVFVDELVNMFLAHTSESKHTNLVLNVLPAVWVSKILQFLNDSGSHFLDSFRHDNEFVVPDFGELRVIEDDVDDSSTMNRRRRVERTSHLLDS
jgi:hypothetical protein